MSHRWKTGWRKLFVREEGSFAQLPLYTRALGAELLKLADDRGRIDCMGKEPWAAIAWRLGATRGDRRMLKRDVGLLLADGYIVRDHDGNVVIRNFTLAHPHLVEQPRATGGITYDIVVEPEAPSVTAPAAPPPSVPSGNEHQLGLFGWGPPAMVEARCDHDRATSAPRDMSQAPGSTAAPPSEVEDTRTQRETPPQVDYVGEQSPSRIAGDLAQQHEQLRARLAGELGLEHVALPLADVFARIDYLVRNGWSAVALLIAFEAAADEVREKRTMRWFNGVDNLSMAALRRAVARRPARRAAARSTPVSTAVESVAPAVGATLADSELIEAMIRQGVPAATATAWVMSPATAQGRG